MEKGSLITCFAKAEKGSEPRFSPVAQLRDLRASLMNDAEAAEGGASAAARPIQLVKIKSTPEVVKARCQRRHHHHRQHRDAEQMEHAFLDLDVDDPASEEWPFKSKEHPDKVSLSHCDKLTKYMSEPF